MINTGVSIYCVLVYKPIYLTYVYIPVHINKGAQIPSCRSPCRLNSMRWWISFRILSEELTDVTLLAPGILRGFLDLWRIFASLYVYLQDTAQVLGVLWFLSPLNAFQLPRTFSRMLHNFDVRIDTVIDILTNYRSCYTGIHYIGSNYIGTELWIVQQIRISICLPMVYFKVRYYPSKLPGDMDVWLLWVLCVVR